MNIFLSKNRRRLVALSFAVVLMPLCAAGADTPQTPVKQQPLSAAWSEYHIGPGDVLQVDVWKEPEASSPGALVRADGKITLPLVKEVDVNNMTTSELEQSLAQKFAKYIPNAEVTVMVKETNSQKVYLVGAVRKEGAMRLMYPMTVLQVLAEAGGVSEYAKRKKIYILRTQGGKQYRMPFDYNAVIRGGHMEQNVVVQPGDTIVVPQ